MGDVDYETSDSDFAEGHDIDDALEANAPKTRPALLHLSPVQNHTSVSISIPQKP